MPVVNMTAAYVDSLRKRPAGEGRVEVWDQKTPGLCLRLGSSGTASWSFRYHPREGTGYQRVTLGTLENLSLADARERAGRYRVQVHDGADPQRERVTKRTAAANALSFDRLAERYLQEYARPRKSSWRNDELYLKRPRAKWGSRDGKSVSRRDAINLLDEIKATAPVSANRTHSVLVTLFNWAVEDELLDVNPIAGMRKRAVEEPKDRTLTDSEFRALWRAMETAQLTPPIIAAFKVLALTGQRPGEVTGMRRQELADIQRAGKAQWELPADRMKKSRRAHVVPLADMARLVLLDQLVDGGESLVFSSRFAAREGVARHSLSQALRRVILGLDATKGNPDAEAIRLLRENPPTPHDLRRTVATRLAELGIPREDRLAVLAHATGDVHGLHYDRYERLKEKRVALQAWEEHVRKALIVNKVGAER